MNNILRKKVAMGRKVMLVLACFLFLAGSWGQERRGEVAKQLEILNAVVKEVEMFYVDTVEMEGMVRRGIQAMLLGLDPYTEYLPEEDVEDLQIITTGEYGGIGSVIRQRRSGEGVMIAEPYEGMPAALAGLKAGDLIVAIDTVNVLGKTSGEVSRLLKGTPNTEVTVTIRRPNEKKERKVKLVRRQILLNTVQHYDVFEHTGYIYLSNFTDKSAQEVQDAFEDMRKQGIHSLILDLRGNGGGLLESAVRIVGMFVPKGSEVISTKGKLKQWERVYRTVAEPLDTLIPLVVLIDEHSASASEIVAGALQDMDRALLIGNRSFGKGLVQSPRDLPHDGKLKVTTSRYYIPSGRCIQQLDYSHRNPDGTVAAIPDSLTSVFYTVGGRPVRDGGGIRPDIEVEIKEVSSMISYLVHDDIFFDFVTDWVQQHENIPPPPTFAASQEDFEALKAYASAHNFSYDRQSIKALNRLKNIALAEGYLDEDSTLLVTLGERLTPDITRDFDRFKTDVKRFLTSEIVKRYYFQRGELIDSLHDDPVLQRALAELSKKEED
ncbi:MAG: S41 family peptidase [Tannerellaceae bacterium]|jgi:carboxyl-terminal processing protease|nr:S41 family peptidase [Tannerellaceae bacterium]